MEPSNDPNEKITVKILIDQLNAYCQADVKKLWTPKRLRTSRDVCGFSYVEKQVGEWIIMPTLCHNCHHILEQAISGLAAVVQPNKKKHTQNIETADDNLFPTPLIPIQSKTSAADTDYLLYPGTNGHTNYQQEGLEFYRPSFATSGCCSIL